MHKIKQGLPQNTRSIRKPHQLTLSLCTTTWLLKPRLTVKNPVIVVYTPTSTTRRATRVSVSTEPIHGKHNVLRSKWTRPRYVRPVLCWRTRIRGRGQRAHVQGGYAWAATVGAVADSLQQDRVRYISTARQHAQTCTTSTASVLVFALWCGLGVNKAFACHSLTNDQICFSPLATHPEW